MRRLKTIFDRVRIPVLILGITIYCFYLWVADRSTDVTYPEGRSGIIFDPRFGPRTPEEAQTYVDKRVKAEWRGHYLREMKPEDDQSQAGQHERDRAIEVLKNRWGLTLDMTQEEIDASREDVGKAWAYLKQRETTRHKVRVFLGMAE